MAITVKSFCSEIGQSAIKWLFVRLQNKTVSFMALFMFFVRSLSGVLFLYYISYFVSHVHLSPWSPLLRIAISLRRQEVIVPLGGWARPPWD